MDSCRNGRICLEASAVLQQQAGLGRYAAGLIQGLMTIDPDGDYAISYNKSQSVNPDPPLDMLPRYTSSLGNKPWRLYNALSYFGAPLMEGFFNGVSVYHSTGHLLPRLRGVRTVFTLHDLIPLRFPEYHLPLNRIFLRVMLPRFLQQADAIVAVSAHTRRDAIRLLGTDPQKITVISEGVDPRFRPVTEAGRLAAVRAAYHLPDKFILYVSTIEPRKNHITLLRAYAAMREQHSEVGLVIAGSRGWMWQEFFRVLERQGLENEVRVIGWVPDSDLPALISAATVFACPSLYEGFGLPPLEAMACGTAVICSSSSSLPEVVGEDALLCGPQDVDGWRDALSRVLQDDEIRGDLEARGKDRAAGFTWEAAARDTRAVYDRVMDM